MKYFLLLLTAVLISSCAGSKELEFGSLSQNPCKNETILSNPGEFVGETVENLTLYQQGDQLYASMEVRSYCNARISFESEKNENQIKLKLYNAAGQTSDCVCIISVTTSLKNVPEGSYNVIVTNRNGNQLLAQKSIQVN